MDVNEGWNNFMSHVTTTLNGLGMHDVSQATWHAVLQPDIAIVFGAFWNARCESRETAQEKRGTISDITKYSISDTHTLAKSHIASQNSDTCNWNLAPVKMIMRRLLMHTSSSMRKSSAASSALKESKVWLPLHVYIDLFVVVFKERSVSLHDGHRYTGELILTMLFCSAVAWCDVMTSITCSTVLGSI